jgi:flavorubredoxin
MQPRKISERVDWVGAIDWDNRLFDSLVPLPEGTSYNAYLVRGSQRTALIDTVEPRFQAGLLQSLAGVERLDYIVSNHAEQDHSGALPALVARFPEAEVLCSIKAKRMLLDLLALPAERIRAVKDGDSVDLGDRTLRFIYTPWVHWPETMSTWLAEEHVLFSCDLFGSHLATSDLFAVDEGTVMTAAKRYYAEIMMPYRKHVAANLDVLADLDIRVVAPSHGPVHARPAVIMDAYRRWASAAPRNRAVIAYVSMHDSTRRMVDRLVGALIDRGVGVDRFDLTVTDLGQLAMALVEAGTIVIATPTVLEGPHPLAASAAYVVNMLNPKARFVAAVGSFAWNSKAITKLQGLLEDTKAEWLPPVVGRGHPGAEVTHALDGLADAIALRHRENGFAS